MTPSSNRKAALRNLSKKLIGLRHSWKTLQKMRRSSQWPRIGLRRRFIVAAIAALAAAADAPAQVSFGHATPFNDEWRFALVGTDWRPQQAGNPAVEAVAKGLPVATADRQRTTKDFDWTAFDDSAARQPDFDDSRWRTLDVPHDWSVEHPMSPSLFSCTGYLPGGVGWYRKHFQINRPSTDARQTAADTQYYIYFEGVYNRAEVWLNGHRLGMRPNGYASVLYNLTPYLNSEGDNVIAVRVDHSRQADSRWYTGSGIYRPVWLVSAPPVHLAQWGSAWRLKKIDAKMAQVEVDVETETPPPPLFRGESNALENNIGKNNTTNSTKNNPPSESPVASDTPLNRGVGGVSVVSIFDPSGRQVAQAQTTIGPQERRTLTLKIAKPQRWDIGQGRLYTVRTLLRDARTGETTDSSVMRMGLRTLDFSPSKGFAINGRSVKVKGVCLHHDAGVLGAVVPRDVWERRLKNLQAIGVNAIRMSHNPQAPVVYELCDSLGLLVMDEASDEWEFPKRKWLSGWNQGEPGYEGTYDFFEEWIDRDVADMVRRDRNHPSVFLWSIGNEVDYPNDPYTHPVLDGSSITQPMYGGYKPGQPEAERIGRIAQRLTKVVRQWDTTRPTTGALAGVVMSNETAYPDAVDVVGYNYTESRYDEDHARYPRRVIYGSENRHDLAAWQAVAQRDFIFGQFLWTGIDYLGESGRWPARGSSAGLLDLKGDRKPLGWWRASLWSDSPVCYIGTYPLVSRGAAGGQRRGRDQRVSIYANDVWNYADGQVVRVVCTTNQPQARLLLNGAEVGEPTKKDPETGVVWWDIPYEPGTLRAEALDDAGQAVAHYDIQTTGQPAALRLTTDKTSLAGKGRVAHVVIEVVDAEGRPVPLADSEVFVRVGGSGTLLGLENGDMTDTSNLRDARQRVLHGRLLAYVQATRPGGAITIQATSPLLKSAEMELKVE